MKDSNDFLSDFCILTPEPGSHLSRIERLTLTGGKELERAVRAFQRGIELPRLKESREGITPSRIKEIANYYQNSEWLHNPKTFYRNASDRVAVSEQVIHGLPDGEILDISFVSNCTPHHPELQDEQKLFPENRKAWARYWRHNETARGTIIALHGWSMGDQRINSLAFLPGYFYQMGFNVLLPELPFHGRRRPEDIPEDISLFPDSNPIRINETVRQCIYELRCFKEYIGKDPLGCIGMSLGAYLAALWASLDNLEFVVTIVPLADMAEVAWKVLMQYSDWAELKKEGLNSDDLRKIFYIHSPLSYKLQCPHENAMIVAGLGDSIIPARQPKMLWQHWNYPELKWFRGGHLLEFTRSKANREIFKFVDKF
ncbi:MAG: hypothetical protein D6719_10670 [Candidatus Dadabacteria bacterium]|nr:MAG: hypothetical protein D6719_10670 [Candidatus Dadabacteria bacterium]